MACPVIRRQAWTTDTTRRRILFAFPAAQEYLVGMKPIVVTLVLCAASLLLAPAHAAAIEADTAVPVVRLVGEAGFLGVIDHRIRYSEDDPTFQYHKAGGQDVLFPFARLSAELLFRNRHTIGFLYQPFELETRADLQPGFSVEGVSFEGDSLVSLYRFPFYRLSYLYQFIKTDRWRLDGGGSLQIRNATIEFRAQGTGGGGGPSGFYRSAGVGPVPLLKLRARYHLPQDFYLETEIDGIYAPISYLNGSDNETVGALLDASLRAGYRVSESLEAFINLRYLGGGASNTNPADYTVNWLNTYSVSLGTAVRLGD